MVFDGGVMYTEGGKFVEKRHRPRHISAEDERAVMIVGMTLIEVSMFGGSNVYKLNDLLTALNQGECLAEEAVKRAREIRDGIAICD